MSPVEIVIPVVAVIAAGALVLSWSERDSIDRDHDPTHYAPQGGHRPDPPGMRKPPTEGGLLKGDRWPHRGGTT
jgi:hypothetical protein